METTHILSLQWDDVVYLKAQFRGPLVHLSDGLRVSPWGHLSPEAFLIGITVSLLKGSTFGGLSVGLKVGLTGRLVASIAIVLLNTLQGRTIMDTWFTMVFVYTE